MKHLLLAVLTGLAAFGAANGQAASLPPGADPGQCFTRVLAPAITETVTETVLIKPESYTTELVPAVFEASTRRVLVREETVEFRIVPAVFGTLTEQVMVEPERIEVETIPARYETFTETLIVQPERVVWKPGQGLYGRLPGASGNRADPTATGGVLCRVVEPAVTETVERVRLVSPPTTRERIIPARFETVQRRVMVSPARVEEVIVPAEYREVPIRLLVKPAEERRITLPAEYQTISREVVVGGGDLVWAEVLCQTNTTRYKVAEIQGALTDAGYPTRIDGVFGPDTLRAMQRFQRDNALADGYLTIETVRALGIDPYDRPPDLVYALLDSRSADA